MSTPSQWPWGEGTPDASVVYQLPLDLIGVPDLRVTSTFSPDQLEELKNSLLSEGQKLPVELVWCDSRLVLSDGLNRLVAMRQLGITTVKALVKMGTMKDVQIANVITARHRGKENPAQTAEVLRDLIENEHMNDKEVKLKLGLADTTFKRLLAISRLAPEIKDHLKYGRLGVMAAFHIAQIENSVDAIALATQAVSWHYTEDQVKARVIQLLNPDIDAKPGGYVFEPTGRPQVVLPRCAMCLAEVSTAMFPVAHCENCAEAYARFRTYYQEQLAKPPAGPEVSSG